ncbi:NmrA family protein [Flammeovirgaceae bacterium 311]|nr:NmrA family protein [Flammeovirgaceae bacterium 311]
MLFAALDKPISFISPSPIMFFLAKRKAGFPTAFILVMIMLHYLPRYQKPPCISQELSRLTGEEPASLAGFIQ